MDGTVLLVTSRESTSRKLETLKQCCDSYGTKIILSKTEFFVICGTVRNRKPLEVCELVVESCNQHIYLSYPFTADGCVSAVKIRASTKMAHVNKFICFLKKYNDIPFCCERESLMPPSCRPHCPAVSLG